MKSCLDCKYFNECYKMNYHEQCLPDMKFYEEDNSDL